MDDTRIQWIAKQVCLGLNVNSEAAFEDLIRRENGKNRVDIVQFLDQTVPRDNLSLLFYALDIEEKIEVKLGECVVTRLLDYEH